MFLDAAQLEQLTGYTQKAAQVRWLQRNGIRHFVRCDGRAIVPVTSIEGRPETVGQAARIEPNLEAVRRAR
jgi:hypothetical protein